MAAVAEPRIAPDEVSTRLSGTVTRTLSHLEAQLAVVETRLDELPNGGFDKDLATSAAALARAVKDLSTEVRQLDKHKFRPFKSEEERFAELLRYVRTLNAPQLAGLGGLVDQLRKGRPA